MGDFPLRVVEELAFPANYNAIAEVEIGGAKALLCCDDSRIDLYDVSASEATLINSRNWSDQIAALRSLRPQRDDCAVVVSANAQIAIVRARREGLEILSQSTAPSAPRIADARLNAAATRIAVWSAKGEAFFAALDKATVGAPLRWFFPFKIHRLCFTAAEEIAVVRPAEHLSEYRIVCYSLAGDDSLRLAPKRKEIVVQTHGSPTVVHDVAGVGALLAVLGYEWLRVYAYEIAGDAVVRYTLSIAPVYFGRLLALEESVTRTKALFYVSYASAPSHSSLLATAVFAAERPPTLTSHLRDLRARSIDATANGALFQTETDIRRFADNSERVLLRTVGAVSAVAKHVDGALLLGSRGLLQIRSAFAVRKRVERREPFLENCSHLAVIGIGADAHFVVWHETAIYWTAVEGVSPFQSIALSAEPLSVFGEGNCAVIVTSKAIHRLCLTTKVNSSTELPRFALEAASNSAAICLLVEGQKLLFLAQSDFGRESAAFAEIVFSDRQINRFQFAGERLFVHCYFENWIESFAFDGAPRGRIELPRDDFAAIAECAGRFLYAFKGGDFYWNGRALRMHVACPELFPFGGDVLVQYVCGRIALFSAEAEELFALQDSARALAAIDGNRFAALRDGALALLEVRGDRRAAAELLCAEATAVCVFGERIWAARGNGERRALEQFANGVTERKWELSADFPVSFIVPIEVERRFLLLLGAKNAAKLLIVFPFEDGNAIESHSLDDELHALLAFAERPRLAALVGSSTIRAIGVGAAKMFSRGKSVELTCLGSKTFGASQLSCLSVSDARALLCERDFAICLLDLPLQSNAPLTLRAKVVAAAPVRHLRLERDAEHFLVFTADGLAAMYRLRPLNALADYFEVERLGATRLGHAITLSDSAFDFLVSATGRLFALRAVSPTAFAALAALSPDPLAALGPLLPLANLLPIRRPETLGAAAREALLSISLSPNMCVSN